MSVGKRATSVIALNATARRNQTNVMLHSLPIPTAPWQQWAVDHLNLTRPTVDGYTAINVFIHAFKVACYSFSLLFMQMKPVWRARFDLLFTL